MGADRYGQKTDGIGGTLVDAFGRVRISQPYTLFENANRFGLSNNKWSVANTGTTSTTFNANTGCVELTVGTASGDSIIRETQRVFPYQPGKSLLILNTGTMNEPKANLVQRIGYFGANNGIFFEQDGANTYIVLRSSVTGNTVDTRIEQSNWSVDKFDGSGPSNHVLDISKSQIFWSDIEWLGVGSVRSGFIIDGQIHVAHVFHHANKITDTYMTTASLPIRYEIKNTGITTSNSTLCQICSSIISEGGYNQVTLSRSASNPITGKNIGTTGVVIPMVSIRLRPERRDAIVLPYAMDLYGLQATAFKFTIIVGGTLTNPNWQITDSESSVEYDIAATAITGGEIFHQGIFRGQAQVDTLFLNDHFNHTLQLRRTLNEANGVIFTVAIEATTQNDDAVVSLAWQEHTI